MWTWPNFQHFEILTSPKKYLDLAKFSAFWNLDKSQKNFGLVQIFLPENLAKFEKNFSDLAEKNPIWKFFGTLKIYYINFLKNPEKGVETKFLLNFCPRIDNSRTWCGKFSLGRKNSRWAGSPWMTPDLCAKKKNKKMKRDLFCGKIPAFWTASRLSKSDCDNSECLFFTGYLLKQSAFCYLDGGLNECALGIIWAGVSCLSISRGVRVGFCLIELVLCLHVFFRA